MIHTYIPYAPQSKDFNLGWAYNNFMEMVKDDDWVLFLDHDATFTTKYWYHQVNDIINKHPKYGVFSCFTNRIGDSSCQKVEGIDDEDHNMKYHRHIGRHLSTQYYDEVEEYPSNFLLSGVIMLISKVTWKTIGGFAEGFEGVDNVLHKDCIKHNIPVGLMKGMYVYHWYRGGNSKEDWEHINKSRQMYQNALYRDKRLTL